MTTIAQNLPEGFVAYARSPEFTTETLPQSLQAAHKTKTGTWALLHVLEGKVLYQLEAPNTDMQLVSVGEHVVIEDQVSHFVKFVEPGRAYIEFFRKNAET